VAEEIDSEVRKIINDAHEVVQRLLLENRDKLDLLVQRLLEVETISQEEFLELIGEKPVPEPEVLYPSANKRAVPAAPKEAPASDGSEDDRASRLGTAPTPA
jgi:hypothetical protein